MALLAGVEEILVGISHVSRVERGRSGVHLSKLR